ncbi:DUF1007 family protein [uncultured Maritimibacter sp.]|uniref:DUF1007 family protein n=1 Tax=uncultured Maritimibacter sp. TaxID=991866 RepID=UPI000A8C1D6F|nr:DUF1007 family protein [uncultured Maritimibacter sp.]
MRKIPILCLMTTLATCPAGAHPHVFIDTSFTLVIENGLATAVRIDWAYDAFYTMLMIEEYGLDTDGDGLPEQEAMDAFAGHDVDWEAGFPGDFRLTSRGADVALRGPVRHEARFEANRVITSHIRPVETPFAVGADRVTARAYDPTYFVAYDVPDVPGVEGANCTFDRDKADIEAAQAEYGEQLAAIDQSEDPFEVVELSDIGILFADTFTLRCDP